MPMVTSQAPRARSPAFQGARLASSPLSATQKSPKTDHSGSQGALIAAIRVGNARNLTAVDKGPASNTLSEGRDAAAWSQRDKNATSSYIAAKLAARLSTERPSLPKASLSSSGRSWPSPSRSQSDITMRPKTTTPSVNALISHYEESNRQDPTDMHLEDRLDNRVLPLDALGNGLIDSASRQLTSRSHGRPGNAFTDTRSSLSSTDSSSYASAADEPSLLPRTTSSQLTRLGPPVKPCPRPMARCHVTVDKTVTTNCRRPIPPPLSDRTVPQLSIDSLANAMVASSLASSRAPSPTRPPLPLPRRRSRTHLFHRTHSADGKADSRTPSPSKGAMRQTMRAPVDPTQQDHLATKHSRSRFINKHPNKHHEGDRKRWRDQITEFERKRYEGVWAANKGLLTSTYQHPNNESSVADALDPANGVLNTVVRDIWSRSKLPSDVLEEIWDLVTLNRDTGGLLSKEEFVVGMWFVDQKLKGRKLPVEVSDSVWFSARGLAGIKVKRRH